MGPGVRRDDAGVIADVLPSTRPGSASVHLDAIKISPSLAIAQGKGGRCQGRLIVTGAPYHCLRKFGFCRVAANEERKGEAHESVCCICVCHWPRPDGGVRSE